MAATKKLKTAAGFRPFPAPTEEITLDYLRLLELQEAADRGGSPNDEEYELFHKVRNFFDVGCGDPGPGLWWRPEDPLTQAAYDRGVAITEAIASKADEMGIIFADEDEKSEEPDTSPPVRSDASGLSDSDQAIKRTSDSLMKPDDSVR